MANPEQVALLQKGVQVWNAWRKKNKKTKIDLREAVLVAVDLRRVDLTEADLSGAHLAGAFLDRAELNGAVARGARLFRAHLGEATMEKADLTDADLGGAHLANVDLRHAILRRTRLRGVNLYGAKLSGTKFHEAQAGRTLFGNVDLSTAQGLDEVQHLEASTLGLDSYVKSKGKIPAAFLLGVGIPEDVVRHMQALTFGSPRRRK